MAPRLITVMVVDDHPAILEHVGRWVARSGVAEVVAVCRDPGEAVAVWQQVRPDVLLTDLQMPGIDGLALTALVLAEDPGAAVVVFSAKAGREFEAVCRAAGAHGFVSKNAAPGELAAVLVAAAQAAGCGTA